MVVAGPRVEHHEVVTRVGVTGEEGAGVEVERAVEARREPDLVLDCSV